MLVLSRKIGEAIMVGDNIRITVEDIRGEKVRLGFVAPVEVTVDRLEVHEKRLKAWSESPTSILSEDLLLTRIL